MVVPLCTDIFSQQTHTAKDAVKFPIDWCMGLPTEYFTAKRYDHFAPEICLWDWHSKTETPYKVYGETVPWDMGLN